MAELELPPAMGTHLETHALNTVENLNLEQIRTLHEAMSVQSHRPEFPKDLSKQALATKEVNTVGTGWSDSIKQAIQARWAESWMGWEQTSKSQGDTERITAVPSPSRSISSSKLSEALKAAMLQCSEAAKAEGKEMPTEPSRDWPAGKISHGDKPADSKPGENMGNNGNGGDKSNHGRGNNGGGGDHGDGHIHGGDDGDDRDDERHQQEPFSYEHALPRELAHGDNTSLSAIKQSAESLHACTEYLKSGRLISLYDMQCTFQKACKDVEKLEELPEGVWKTELREYFQIQSQNFLKELVLHITARAESGSLLASIKDASDEHQQWQSLRYALKELSPTAYRAHQNHPELQQLKLTRLQAKELNPLMGTFYTLLQPMIPYPDDPRSSLLKIAGALLDVKRRDDFPDNLDHPHARLAKMIEINELVLKLGTHRPDDGHSLLIQDHVRLNQQVLQEILLTRNVDSMADLNQQRLQDLRSRWEEYLSESGKYLTVLPEFSHVEGERQQRLNLQPVDTHSPAFQEMVRETGGHFIFSVYNDPHTHEIACGLLPRFLPNNESTVHSMFHYTALYAGEINNLSKTDPYEFWMERTPSELQQHLGRLSRETLVYLFSTSQFSEWVNQMPKKEIVHLLEHPPTTFAELYTRAPFTGFVEKHYPYTGDVTDQSGHFHPKGSDLEMYREVIRQKLGIYIRSTTYGAWLRPVTWWDR